MLASTAWENLDEWKRRSGNKRGHTLHSALLSAKATGLHREAFTDGFQMAVVCRPRVQALGEVKDTHSNDCFLGTEARHFCPLDIVAQQQ